MNKTTVTSMNHKLSQAACGAVILASMALTGCQGLYSGQVLPSGYYLQDDVQYFAPGPEFKLAREAQALEEAKAEIESVPQGR
ncbi:hypothetical protein [Aeoliella sp.]|uniref:hypothetical protein n=1 Tax=Aeoliella sp. TaxID=2795800 RepID=UPI003CCC4308